MQTAETFKKLGIDAEQWRLKSFIADESLYEL